MAQPNPYTPGAGDRPRALVGRSDQLALAESVRTQIEAHYAANCLVYVGLRGVGKTVLLKEVSDRLEVAGWYAPYIEVRRNVGVDTALAQVADRFGQSLSMPGRLKKRLGELQRRGGALQVMGTGPTVGQGRAVDGYTTLSKVLEALAQAALDDGTGVALIVDELQALSKTSLGSLVHLVQDLRDRLPFAFIGAGLPYLPSYIAKAATYTERFRYEPTDYLDDLDARAAVLEPATDEAAVWDDDALNEVVRLAEGYPYFLQLYASAAWEVAGRELRVERVRLGDVVTAVPIVRRQIEAGIYVARFDQIGEAGRKYLYEMLRLSKNAGRKGRARSGEVAKGVGVSVFAASPTRDALIHRGVIHAPEHGIVEFSIPGFGEYLARRAFEDGIEI